MTDSIPRVLCFGEILWDFLPAGLFVGGAPFNVAYHLKHHGIEPLLVSAVGRDRLGEELLRRVRHGNMDTRFIAKHGDLATGYVRATLGETGDARYEIISNIAWDRIPVNDDTVRAAQSAQALVFGSLAQRSSPNRAALDRLLQASANHAWRVFDVNLRPPHDDLDRVRILAARSTLLKLNAEEAARLCGDSATTPDREEAHARHLANTTGCPVVCITAGERGAGLMRNGTWLWEPGQPVAVVDTVGAGDAFLASLLTDLLAGRLNDVECLARACRTGEWVATQRGATPVYAGDD